ncbi:cupin domain-containing protein [Phytomonospora sp. NPDC050363]|uniref:cupin domain-containing protein n=1 Tax=Phytomonospora sp. NPDC050363 TaxID=3155642 RepID=UPI0033FF197D
MTDITLSRATEAETLTSDPAAIITLLADSGTTGGAITANRSKFTEGSFGAPPHFHARATEAFFVLGGRLQVLTGEEIVTLSAGDFLVVPPETPHAFAPAPGHEADVLVVFTPGNDRFDYYRLLDRLARKEATYQDLRDSQERFDNHYTESAVWSGRKG